MASARDDEAFTWDGDDDPTLEPATPSGVTEAAHVALPEGYTAVGKGSEDLAERTLADAEADDSDSVAASPADSASLGNVALVTFGVLGGIYLLFTVGWIFAGLRLAPRAALLVSPAASVPALWLAVLAPALWFVTVLVVVRRRALWLRFALLVGGLLLLLPWPFLMLGAVGT